MADTYNIQAILEDLNEKEEMQADQHDGCYELIHKTIQAFAKLSDLSILNYKDLNLVYLTTVGTWSHGLDAKKKTINESHLNSEDKEELIKLWDDIWDKAGQGKYSNSDTSCKEKRSIGLFGTGFYSFKRNNSEPTSEQIKAFFSMLIDFLSMTNDIEMFNRAETVLNGPFPGMQTAAASMILHCLKPYSFPVLNSNTGYHNIFEVIGIKLTKTYSLENYIDNCRKIKDFRDKHFTYKNYRIFDIEAQKIDSFKVSSTNQERYGFLEMVSFLSEYSGVHYTTPEKAGENESYMITIKNRGQDARQKLISFAKKVIEYFPELEFDSCSQWKNQGQLVERYLWVELKNSKWKEYPQSVSISIEKHGDVYPGEGYYLSVRAETRDVNSKPEDYKRQMRLMDCDLLDGMTYRTKYKDQNYHFHGTDKEGIKTLLKEGTIVKIEIIEAIENLPEKDEAGSILTETIKAVREIYPLYEYVMQQENTTSTNNGDELFREENDEMEQSGRNIILYGPPGTGKTYNSIIYAVAICKGVSIDQLKNEPYEDILMQYDILKKSGQIGFTTFHQSYGYEEFIEGIKPILNSEKETLGYTIEDGVFKAFCKNARLVKVQANSKIKAQPKIWGMILGGTGMTDIKKKCFNNNEIRLGFSYVDDTDINDGDFITDDKSSWRVKQMIYDFKNSMEIGDIVIIENSLYSIDAIGVITGNYKCDNSNYGYPRCRKVEWLIKDKDINITSYLTNGRKQLARCSVFSFDHLGMDSLSKILNEQSTKPVIEVEQENKPHVFIIDEINRGNISKIFGELITLIEDKKRAGVKEAMEAILPYSGEYFSVPKNVYIIGTMNTADRSIALMDTALRRRFIFKEMLPDSKVLDKLGISLIEVGDDELNLSHILDTINKRIEFLFDREHTIGHAFFTKLASSRSKFDTLVSIFENNVIPLLQEYFYEDYEKIQLVLGDNTKEDEYKFILDRPVKVTEIFNGNPDIDLPEKSYEVQHSAFRKIESYKQIDKDY